MDRSKRLMTFGLIFVTILAVAAVLVVTTQATNMSDPPKPSTLPVPSNRLPPDRLPTRKTRNGKAGSRNSNTP